jgi:hypothetical protein
MAAGIFTEDQIVSLLGALVSHEAKIEHESITLADGCGHRAGHRLPMVSYHDESPEKFVRFFDSIRWVSSAEDYLGRVALLKDGKFFIGEARGLVNSMGNYTEGYAVDLKEVEAQEVAKLLAGKDLVCLPKIVVGIVSAFQLTVTDKFANPLKLSEIC